MSEVKTCFKKVDYDLSALLHYIDIGDIGLPDIQRPFVWSNTKVRDLFDSMYRGFPVGYLLFWENGGVNGAKQIGLADKAHAVPMRLIVDGQQRLTSLYAVFRGRKVLDDAYRERKIEIAFRPRDGKFEVCGAAIRKDPEWISDISKLWASGKSSYQIVKEFLRSLEKAKGPLPEDEEERISQNLDRLFDLQKYPFTALEIASTVDEEEVADIFVRINSEGVKLNQADFILTLLSVFWDEGRAALEKFCRESRRPPTSGDRPSPFNHLIEPDPDQLLRVAIAVGLHRGRLKAVYNLLRGKDVDTGEYDPERREQQFSILREAQARVVDLTRWHQFLSAIIGAGFRSAELISSQNTLLYAYVFYLVGRDRFKMPEHVLSKLIGRWFFFTSLTGRYTASPETVMDAEMNRLRSVNDETRFTQVLDDLINTELTEDFWNVSLPAQLETSSARSPALFAFIAAQVLLGAPVLFSHKKIGDLLDPSLKTKKKALERHHLFPRAWLEKQGITDRRLINQQANLALLEWPDNLVVRDHPPAAYVPEIRKRFGEAEWRTMCEIHALPEGWEKMSYEVFLQERRKRMAGVIRRGYERLL